MRHDALRTPLRTLALLAALALLSACGTARNTISQGADARLMLHGFDPVAYFTEGQPVPGLPEIKADHDGVTYRFADDTNRATFLRQPKRYVPAYAGFCASGAPYALKAAIGANHFKIVDDRLFLFGSERAKRHWEMDEARNIELGDRYWEEETRDVPYRLQNLKRYVFRVPHYKTDDELEAEYLAQRTREHGKPAR